MRRLFSTYIYSPIRACQRGEIATVGILVGLIILLAGIFAGRQLVTYGTKFLSNAQNAQAGIPTFSPDTDPAYNTALTVTVTSQNAATIYYCIGNSQQDCNPDSATASVITGSSGTVVVDKPMPSFIKAVGKNALNVSSQVGISGLYTKGTTGTLPNLAIPGGILVGNPREINIPISATVTLVNNGTVSANPATYIYTNQGGGTSALDQAASTCTGSTILNPGQSCVSVYNFVFTTAGAKTLAVKADGSNLVTESDENDNTAAITLNVVDPSGGMAAPTVTTLIINNPVANQSFAVAAAIDIAGTTTGTNMTDVNGAARVNFYAEVFSGTTTTGTPVVVSTLLNSTVTASGINFNDPVGPLPVGTYTLLITAKDLAGTTLKTSSQAFSVIASTVNKLTCTVDADCGCGIDVDTAACAVENTLYLGGGQCTTPDFCPPGVGGNLILECSPQGQCRTTTNPIGGPKNPSTSQPQMMVKADNINSTYRVKVTATAMGAASVECLNKVINSITTKGICPQALNGALDYKLEAKVYDVATNTLQSTSTNTYTHGPGGTSRASYNFSITVPASGTGPNTSPIKCKYDGTIPVNFTNIPCLQGTMFQDLVNFLNTLKGKVTLTYRVDLDANGDGIIGPGDITAKVKLVFDEMKNRFILRLKTKYR